MGNYVELLTKQQQEKFREWVKENSTDGKQSAVIQDMEKKGISNYHLYYMYVEKIPIPESHAMQLKMPKDTVTVKDAIPEPSEIKTEVATMPAKKTNKKATTKSNRGEKTAAIKKLLNAAKLSVKDIAEQIGSTILAVRSIKYIMNKKGELSQAAINRPRDNAAAPKAKAKAKPAKKKVTKKKVAKKKKAKK